MQFTAILNRDGGTFRTMDMGSFCARAIEIFNDCGHSLTCHTVAGADVEAALKRAASTSEALLAGGGDGTVSAAAAAALAHNIPLAVLPGGTMNLFARSLHIPFNLEEALRALACGEVIGIDIATANGRPFVHQFSVGIHARLVRLREQLPYHSRLGKMMANTRAVMRAVSRPPNFWAEISAPDSVMRCRVSGIAISNNLLAAGYLPHADQLHRGVLGLYVLSPLSTLALLRICLGVVLGNWKANPWLSEREITEVSLLFPKRKYLAQAVIDGELIALADRVDFKMLCGALKVVAPKAGRQAEVEVGQRENWSPADI